VDQVETTTVIGSTSSPATTPAQHPPTPVVVIVDEVKVYPGSVVAAVALPGLGTDPEIFLGCSARATEGVGGLARVLLA